MKQVNIYDEIKRLWDAACKHDGIPRDSKFVVFSESNPYTKKHDKLLRFIQMSAIEHEKMRLNL